MNPSLLACSAVRGFVRIGRLTDTGPGQGGFWGRLDGLTNKILHPLHQPRSLYNLILQGKFMAGNVIYNLPFIHPLQATFDYRVQLCPTCLEIRIVDPVVSLVQAFFGLLGWIARRFVRIETCAGVSGSDINFAIDPHLSLAAPSKAISGTSSPIADH